MSHAGALRAWRVSLGVYRARALERAGAKRAKNSLFLNGWREACQEFAVFESGDKHACSS